MSTSEFRPFGGGRDVPVSIAVIHRVSRHPRQSRQKRLRLEVPLTTRHVSGKNRRSVALGEPFIKFHGDFVV